MLKALLIASFPSQVIACSTLASEAVLNADGERFGELAHIVIDMTTGRIAYGVVARGGVFGIGEKLFAIPWSAFSLDPARECMVLDIAAERLDAAPGFDKDHWPEMADPAWAMDVHRYYESPACRFSGSRPR